MADDNIFIVYQRIITLLRAESTFIGNVAPATVKAQNFITFDGSRPDPTPQTRSDAQYPEVIFDVSTSQAWRDYGLAPPVPQTFCTVAGGTSGINTQRNVVYEFAITGADMRLQPVADVVTAIETALFKAGSRFGIPTVVASWGPTLGLWGKTAGDASANTYRRFCKIQLPVLFKLASGTITG